MNNTNHLIGVKLYEYDGNPTKLFAEWESLSINTAFISPDLAINRYFTRLAVEYSITRYVIVPIFYQPEILERNPDLYGSTNLGTITKDDWLEFICPSRQEFQQNQIETIRQIIIDCDPDGISLDFIRHFVYWEMIYPDHSSDSIVHGCFDDQCLHAFQRETGLMVPRTASDTPEKAAWILDNHLDTWSAWKCYQITSLVQTIVDETKSIKRDIKINIHGIPWCRDDYGGAIKWIAGQNYAALAKYIDFISPMCYSHMLKREPEWIHDVVKDFKDQASCKIVPSIQVSNHYLNTTLTPEVFKQCLDEALKSPSSGVIFWSWDAIQKDKSKAEIIKRIQQ
jgi:hypothetical protein